MRSAAEHDVDQSPYPHDDRHAEETEAEGGEQQHERERDQPDEDGEGERAEVVGRMGRVEGGRRRVVSFRLLLEQVDRVLAKMLSRLPGGVDEVGDLPGELLDLRIELGLTAGPVRRAPIVRQNAAL